MLAQLLIGQRGQPGVAQQRHVQRLHRAGALDGRVHRQPAADRGDVGVPGVHRHRAAIRRFGVRAIEGRNEIGRTLHVPNTGAVHRFSRPQLRIA